MSGRFEADLCPETEAPRVRFNFANGWCGSLVLRMPATNGCDFSIASVAACPTGKWGGKLTELGETEASPDEAIAWLAGVALRTTSREVDYHALARQIVDSEPIITTYAAPEWRELDENGQEWVVAIVQAATCVHASDGLAQLLDDLQRAEADYRRAHDYHGDGSSEAGSAWDLMRRAGDRARAALNTRHVFNSTVGAKGDASC